MPEGLIAPRVLKYNRRKAFVTPNPHSPGALPLRRRSGSACKMQQPHRTSTNVGRGGLEPPRVSPLAPKASASANFAIYPLWYVRVCLQKPWVSQACKYNSWTANLQNSENPVEKATFEAVEAKPTTVNQDVLLPKETRPRSARSPEIFPLIWTNMLQSHAF